MEGGFSVHARANYSCIFIYMNIRELQNWVQEDWDKRSPKKPSLELQLLFLMEEVGEIAEAIRKDSGSKNRVNKETDLGSEISDAIICLLTIANHFGVDTEKEIKSFQTKLEERHKKGY